MMSVHECDFGKGLLNSENNSLTFPDFISKYLWCVFGSRQLVILVLTIGEGKALSGESPLWLGILGMHSTLLTLMFIFLYLLVSLWILNVNSEVNSNYLLQWRTIDKILWLLSTSLFSVLTFCWDPFILYMCATEKWRILSTPLCELLRI